jgi:protein FRA10AC1
MRWRTKNEVIEGKGQTICGSINCNNVDGLHSYEVPFQYMEEDIEKFELVKVRACPKCSKKMFKKFVNEEKSLNSKKRSRSRDVNIIDTPSKEEK